MTRPEFIRQKRRPPKDARCDAHIGTDTTGYAPTLIKCGQPATVEFQGGGLPFETWVCEVHASKLEGRPSA